jgi:hypothetical protein
MSLHKEIDFENDICAHLAAHGWLYQPAPACRQTGLAAAEHPQWVGRGCKDAEASATTHCDFAAYDRTRVLISAAVTGKIDVRALSPSPSPMLGEGSVQEAL